MPRVNIEDKPNYKYRGFSLDCARHFWRVEKIKQILDVMSHIKMNEFHWHLTDDQGWRVQLKKYPLLTQRELFANVRRCLPRLLWVHGDWGYDENEYGRNLFYTQDDMRDIVAYAKEKTYRGRTRDRYARTYGRGNIVLSQFVVYARTSRRQHSMGCLG